MPFHTVSALSLLNALMRDTFSILTIALGLCIIGLIAQSAYSLPNIMATTVGSEWIMPMWDEGEIWTKSGFPPRIFHGYPSQLITPHSDLPKVVSPLMFKLNGLNFNDVLIENMTDLHNEN